MSFDLEKSSTGVFAPVASEVLTVLHNFPRGDVADNAAWQERPRMAEEWHEGIIDFSQKKQDPRSNPGVRA